MLILAESYDKRLWVFDIAANSGSLNRRTWADIQGGVPDCIFLDAGNAKMKKASSAAAIIGARAGNGQQNQS
jgi:hypothetical protein